MHKATPSRTTKAVKPIKKTSKPVKKVTKRTLTTKKRIITSPNSSPISAPVSITKKSMSGSVNKIVAELAPAAIGPYSHAKEFNGMIFVSGQLPLDTSTGKLVNDTNPETAVAMQARQCLVNLGHILKAGKSDYNRVLKTTVLLTDMGHFPIVNKVYAEFFPQDAPARICYAVSRLPMDAMVEIDAVAAQV